MLEKDEKDFQQQDELINDELFRLGCKDNYQIQHESKIQSFSNPSLYKYGAPMSQLMGAYYIYILKCVPRKNYLFLQNLEPSNRILHYFFCGDYKVLSTLSLFLSNLFALFLSL